MTRFGLQGKQNRGPGRLLAFILPYYHTTHDVAVIRLGYKHSWNHRMFMRNTVTSGMRPAGGGEMHK